jgi:hypothetical protein
MPERLKKYFPKRVVQDAQKQRAIFVKNSFCRRPKKKKKLLQK